MQAGSRGDHRTRLRQDMLQQLFEDHVMELLLTMAQHAGQVAQAECSLDTPLYPPSPPLSSNAG